MIRKVYEVDPMICSKCGSLAVLMEQRLHEWGRMKVVAFITEVALMEAMRTSKAAVVDRIIDHLKLGFVAAKPQPCSPSMIAKRKPSAAFLFSSSSSSLPLMAASVF